MHSARLDAVTAHAEEQIARKDAIEQRNLARQAVDRYENAVQRLQHLAAHPELAVLRDSPEYRELLAHLAHSQATIPDADSPPAQQPR